MSRLHPLSAFKPFGKKILVRKGVTGVEEMYKGRKYHMLGGIAITEKRADHQHWCEIIAVGDQCEMFSKKDVGGWVHLPEARPSMMYPVQQGGPDWIVRESLFDKDAPAVVVFM